MIKFCKNPKSQNYVHRKLNVQLSISHKCTHTRDSTPPQVNAAYLAELEAEKEKLEASAQSEDNNSSTTSSHLLRLLENGSSENFLNSLMLIISLWQKLVTYKVEEEELLHSGNTSSISTFTGIFHPFAGIDPFSGIYL